MVDVFRKVLNGELDPAHAKNAADSNVVPHEVFVTPAIVIRMLEQYIANILDSQKLSAWACLLYTSPSPRDRG